MSEDGLSEGIITRSELTDLAVVFDRFEFAFDPRARAAKEAESEFEDQVRKFYDERVVPSFPKLPFATFHCRIKSLCRTYLKKNPPGSDLGDSSPAPSSISP
jgi:hypothetical protein